jgi:hypothetical protein
MTNKRILTANLPTVILQALENVEVGNRSGFIRESLEEFKAFIQNFLQLTKLQSLSDEFYGQSIITVNIEKEEVAWMERFIVEFGFCCSKSEVLRLATILKFFTYYLDPYHIPYERNIKPRKNLESVIKQKYGMTKREFLAKQIKKEKSPAKPKVEKIQIQKKEEKKPVIEAEIEIMPIKPANTVKMFDISKYHCAIENQTIEQYVRN